MEQSLGAISLNLDEGEDRDTLADVVRNLPTWLEDERARLLDHAHLADPTDQRNHFVRPESSKQRAADIVAGKAKRFVLSIDTSAGPRAVKFFTPLGYANRVYYAVRASPSRQAHELTRRASSGPVMLPHSYGFIDLRDDRSLVRSAQVMELLSDLTSLGSYLSTRLKQAGQDSTARRDVIDWLAKQLSSLHQAGFYHPDIKPYHVFVVERSDTERLLLIDMDRARLTKALDIDQRAVNLYQLYRYALYDCSESERFHLMEAYADHHESLGLDPEDLYRRVQRIFKRRSVRDAS